MSASSGRQLSSKLPFRISSRITFFGFLLLSLCSFPFLTFPCEQPFVLRDTFIRAESGKDEIRLFLSNGETVGAAWLLVAKGTVPNMELVKIQL
jgi:hypothetical protein